MNVVEPSMAAPRRLSVSCAVEPMREPDLEEVLAIEHASFPDPWGVDELRSELGHAWSRCVVARHNGRVIGYMVFWALPGELELLRVGCHPDHRRRGVGSALMSHLLSSAASAGATRIHLEVRRSNLAAIALYRDRFGLAEVAVRRRYYRDNREDAVVMQRSLITSGR